MLLLPHTPCRLPPMTLPWPPMTEGGGDNATAVVRTDKNADAAAVEKDEIALEESEMARKAGRRIMLSTEEG